LSTGPLFNRQEESEGLFFVIASVAWQSRVHLVGFHHKHTVLRLINNCDACCHQCYESVRE